MAYRDVVVGDCVRVIDMGSVYHGYCGEVVGVIDGWTNIMMEANIDPYGRPPHIISKHQGNLILLNRANPMVRIALTSMMDERWFELLEEERTAARQAKIAQGPHRFDRDDNFGYWAAKQEQEVVDMREKIEEFAKMIASYKLRGQQIEAFALKHDIPGICGYDGIHNWVDNDIVGDAIQWAHSNHSC